MQNGILIKRHKDMMNEIELNSCENQGTFFELSVSSFKAGSALFISTYMYSIFAKELDNLDDGYNFISPHNLINLMKDEYIVLSKKKGNKYPKEVMRWIGYIYRAYVILKHRNSSFIYKEINAEKMLELYESYHTFDVNYCVDRLEELISEKKPVLSDYEVFKRIRLENSSRKRS